MAAPPTATAAVPELSALLIRLLKGVIYREDDERLWNTLLRLQARVREHAAVLLLDLVLDEAEGHAFLKSRVDAYESEAGVRLPRLVARRSLSYPVSLLLALLRKKLAEFDRGGGDTRLVLRRDDVVELMRVFLRGTPDETRLVDQINATIHKVIDLGFLRHLKPGAAGTSGEAAYEVCRILKTFVDAQWLSDFDARLEAYRAASSDLGRSKETDDA